MKQIVSIHVSRIKNVRQNKGFMHQNQDKMLF